MIVHKKTAFKALDQIISDYVNGVCDFEIYNPGHDDYYMFMVEYPEHVETKPVDLYYWGDNKQLCVDKEDPDGEWYSHVYRWSNDPMIINICEILTNLVCLREYIDRQNSHIELCLSNYRVSK